MSALSALLASADARQMLWLTAQVALASSLLHALFGLAIGYALSRPSWRGRALVDIAVTLPLVFPPMATGFLLLLLFGRHGPLGQPLRESFGIELVFSFPGLVLAAFIAGLPLAVKPIQSAFENLPKILAEAARTLGKNEWQIFWHILLPNIRNALIGGLVLALGRSLGEVGITLMLGGNIEGRTVTASLDIYNAVITGDFERAGAVSLLLGMVTTALFVILRRQSRAPLGW
ncbi:molybdate ABC transporter permease subunit [Azonexus hydrophilus]|uniref:molybdate ABC transporter permease subunit n=1 Tax=Azonexus hydrophilus TaxID=418702 RepID=UPI0004026689|nr:molybdate ABC transporter permease subunit [Azonexus hydrophilus]